MDIATFLLLTLSAHTVFAAGVALHARRRGIDPFRWMVVTLVFGLGGVAGYLMFAE